MKILAGMMAAVIIVSIPVSAAEQADGAIAPETEMGTEETKMPDENTSEEMSDDATVTIPEMNEGESGGEQGGATGGEQGGEAGGEQGGDPVPAPTETWWNISEDGVLTIDHTGEPYETVETDEYYKVPWLKDKENIEKIRSAKVKLTEACTKLDHLFEGCVNLTEVDLGETDASKVATAADLFKGCTSLEKIVTPKNLQIEIAFPVREDKMWVTTVAEKEQELSAIPKGEASITITAKDSGIIKGRIEEAYGIINWSIDEEGKLLIDGKGDYADPANGETFAAPWSKYADKIIRAEVHLTECTVLKKMFQDCVNMVYVNLIQLDTSKVTDIDHFIDNCPLLDTIEAPGIVKIEIPLPVSGEHSEWYLNDDDLTAVKAIPVMEKEGSIEIYRSIEQLTVYSIRTSANRFYAKLTGNDLNRSKLLKDDFWVADFDEDSLRYTGSAIKQDIKVYYRTILLREGTDYTLSYKNNTAVRNKDASGAPQVTVTLKGQFTGTRAVPFSILPADIGDADVSIYEAAASYNGKMQKLGPKVVFNGKTLKKGKDYRVDYEGDTVGSPSGITEVTYIIRGMGNFSQDSVATGKYYIVGADHNLSKATVAYSKSVTYDGTPVTASQLGIVVRIKGTEVSSSDYSVELKNFEKGGTGKIIISPSEAGYAVGYRGRLEKTCKINGAISLAGVVSMNYSAWKDSTPYEKNLCSSSKGLTQGDGLLMDGSTVLMEGIDYTVKYTNNRKKGTARAVFTGCGKYSGKLTKKFKITPATAFVTVAGTTEYAKDGAIPEIEVRDSDDNLLTENTDYTVKCTNNKISGSGTCTVKGKGNYQFEEERTFSITPQVLTDQCIVAPDRASTGGGVACRITPILYDKINGKKLKAGKDYDTAFVYQKKEKDGSLKSISGSDVLQIGDEVRITVRGMGNYTGSCSGDYKIYNKVNDIGKLYIVIDPQVFEYEDHRKDGVSLLPSSSEGEGDIHVYTSQSAAVYNGEELNAYNCVQVVTYTNNKKIGTAAVTLRGIGQYGGVKTYNFEIQPKSVGIVGVSSVKIDKRYIKLNRGDSKQLTATVFPKSADIPGGAEKWTVNWKSGNTKVASVDENGIVTAGSESGWTNITASVTDAKGKKKSASCRVFSNMNVMVVEAVPDDGTDHTDVFNACINSASASNNGTIVWVLDGTYSIDVNAGKKINMKSNVTLHLDNKAVLKALPTGKNDYTMVSFSEVHNAMLEGGKIIGGRADHSGSDGAAGGHCIGIYNSSKVTIKDVDICDAWGDGIRVSGNNKSYDRTVIDHCSIYSNRGNNVAIVSGDGITIKGSVLKDHGTGNGLTIGVKGTAAVTDVKVENSKLNGDSNYTMSISGPAESLVFADVTFEGSVNNAGGNAPKFTNCSISGDLREINDSGYSKFKLAELDNATKSTVSDDRHITKEEQKK